VLNAPLMLPGANEGRHGGLARFGHTFRLDEEQFPIPEFEEGLATLSIGASAEHVFTTFFCSAKNDLGEQLDSESIARRMPRFFLSPLRLFSHPTHSLTAARAHLPTERQPADAASRFLA
jgi:hypothetical protein